MTHAASKKGAAIRPNAKAIKLCKVRVTAAVCNISFFQCQNPNPKRSSRRVSNLIARLKVPGNSRREN